MKIKNIKQNFLAMVIVAIAFVFIFTSNSSPVLGQGGDDMPDGAVMYFNGACPTSSGWNELEYAKGRYVVGVDAGGTTGVMIGKALTNAENRPAGLHTHGIVEPNNGQGHRHSYPFMTKTGDNSGAKLGEHFCNKTCVGWSPFGNCNRWDWKCPKVNILHGNSWTFPSSGLSFLKNLSVGVAKWNGESFSTPGTPAPYIQYNLCHKGPVKWEGFEDTYGAGQDFGNGYHATWIPTQEANDTCDGSVLLTDSNFGMYTCNGTEERTCTDIYALTGDKIVNIMFNFTAKQREITCGGSMAYNDVYPNQWGWTLVKSDDIAITTPATPPPSNADTCPGGSETAKYTCGTTSDLHCMDLYLENGAYYQRNVLCVSTTSYGNWLGGWSGDDQCDRNNSSQYTCTGTPIESCRDVRIGGMYRNVTCEGHSYIPVSNYTITTPATPPPSTDDTCDGNITGTYHCSLSDSKTCVDVSRRSGGWYKATVTCNPPRLVPVDYIPPADTYTDYICGLTCDSGGYDPLPGNSNYSQDECLDSTQGTYYECAHYSTGICGSSSQWGRRIATCYSSPYNQ